jgi:uncharacterized membrane protein
MRVEMVASRRALAYRPPVTIRAGELVIVFAALAWCASLLTLRVITTLRLTYAFLAWNLFLAAIPFALSIGMCRAVRTRVRVCLGCLWLLFFPNAPYILTDFVHLYPRPEAPLWFDMMLLLSAAGAGLLLAFASLRHVHQLVVARTSSAFGWAFVTAVLFLSSFGIYLGRFQRWNSWDILHMPVALGRDVAHRVLVPWEHPRTWVMTIGMGVMLLLGYLATTTLGGRDVRETP